MHCICIMRVCFHSLRLDCDLHFQRCMCIDFGVHESKSSQEVWSESKSKVFRAIVENILPNCTSEIAPSCTVVVFLACTWTVVFVCDRVSLSNYLKHMSHLFIYDCNCCPEKTSLLWLIFCFHSLWCLQFCIWVNISCYCLVF